jgi:hypothetical protein
MALAIAVVIAVMRPPAVSTATARLARAVAVR